MNLVDNASIYYHPICKWLSQNDLGIINKSKAYEVCVVNTGDFYHVSIHFPVMKGVKAPKEVTAIGKTKQEALNSLVEALNDNGIAA